MKEHRQKAAEVVKSVVIFVLCVIMMLLLVLLMLDPSSVQNERLLPEDRMVVYESGAATGYFEGMDSTRVVPEGMAYRSGGALRCLYATESVAKAYETVYPLLRTLLGQGSAAVQLPQNIGETLWEACTVVSRSFYLRYHGALPASVIRAYTFSARGTDVQASALDEVANGAAAYIKELFFIETASLEQILKGTALFSDDAQVSVNTTVSAVARDDRGGIFVYTADTELYRQMKTLQPADDFNAADRDASANEGPEGLYLPRTGDAAMALEEEEPMRTLSAYIDDAADYFTEAHTASFFSEKSEELPLTSDSVTALWMDGVFELPLLQVKRIRFGELLFSDETPSVSATKVLSLLGVRDMDTENYYTDTQGDRVYLNAEGRLVFTHDGIIEYTAVGDDGLSVADYLGYASIGGNYRLSEYLRAADSLLTLLKEQNAALCGGDLHCTLYGVGITQTDGRDTVVITYIYTADGTAVTDADGAPVDVLTLEVSGGKIRRLRLRSADVTRTDTLACVLPQSIVADAILLEEGESSLDEVGTPESVTPGNSLKGEFRLCYFWSIPDDFTDSLVAAEWILKE